MLDIHDFGVSISFDVLLYVHLFVLNLQLYKIYLSEDSTKTWFTVPWVSSFFIFYIKVRRVYDLILEWAKNYWISIYLELEKLLV